MEIKTKLIQNTWLYIPSDRKGFANGYIGLPKGHPWYGKNYNEIHEACPDLAVHGGLTYAEDHLPKHTPDGLWWIGFDTLHLDDNEIACNEAYCQQEVESLKNEALRVLPL